MLRPAIIKPGKNKPRLTPNQGQPVDLREGQTANLLGFAIRWDNGQIDYDLTDEAWANLKVMLSTAQTHSCPESALQAVKGWMDSYGPAFEGKLETPILNRVLEVAAVAGHRELSRHQPLHFLLSSRDKWVKRRQRARNAHKASRGPQDHGRAVAPLTTDHTGHLAMPEADSLQLTAAAVSAH